MTKSCILVMGGEVQDTNALRLAVLQADCLIAADSGANHLLKVGLIPHIIMGDMDSIEPEQLKYIESKGCQIKHFDTCKDDTDGSLILKKAIELGYKNIEIWGGIGGRIDHSFANIMLLMLPEIEQTKHSVRIRDGGLSIFLPYPGQRIIGKPGDIVSLFALGDPVIGFKNQGLKYQPKGDSYIMNLPIGISNELISNEAWLDWEQGKLLCIQYLHET